MSELSHDFLKPVLHGQAICIDGTLGYGRDTRFFLDQGVRQVFAYEIQPDLLENTTKQIEDPRLAARGWSHDQMGHDLKSLKGKVDAVVFNFGFDPHTLEGIVTHPSSSLKAVQSAVELLRIKGRLALVFYPHPEGVQEQEMIFQWLKSQNGLETTYISHPFKQNSPSLLCIEKRHLPRAVQQV